MASDGNLTVKQRKAIAALLMARDVQSAAAQAGVGERTLHRWLKEDEEFQTQLRAAETDAIDTAVRRLTGLAEYAINVLITVMADKAISPSVRLRASLAILEQLVRLREFATLEERVARMELLLADRD